MTAGESSRPQPGWRPSGEGTLVFGGSGFLAPYILERCPQAISVGRTPPPTANRHIHVETLADLDALRDVAFDKVIYIIGNTDHHNLEKDEIPRGEPSAFDYHVTPLLHTMEQLKQYPIKRFLHFSTVLVYDPKRISLPVSERAPIDPYRNRYVLSKYLAEEACKFYARWLPIVNVRMCNLYGYTPLTRFDLIHVCLRHIFETGRAEVWNATPKRDFIYADDAAEGALRLLHSDYTGTVNLGSGTMTSVRQVLDIIEDVTGAEVTVLDQAVGGPSAFRCDTSTLERATGWRARVSVEEGIRRIWELMNVGAPRAETAQAMDPA
jgi:nucleoside-diphosphate-sugar epimerase